MTRPELAAVAVGTALALAGVARLVRARRRQDRHITFVEKLNGGLHLVQWDVQAARDMPQINRYRACHIRSILPE